MKKAEQEAYRQPLEKLVARVAPDARATREETRAPSGGVGQNELSNTPLHLGDRGTEEYLHHVNATLMENEEQLLADVRDALARIDNGTFGDCENCGSPIAATRLKALPFARLCIGCAEELQQVPAEQVQRS